MKRKLSVLVLSFALLVCLYSCTKDRTAVPPAVVCTGIIDTDNTYNKNIGNILNTYCGYAPCHDATSKQVGIEMDTYESTVAAFQSNNIICAMTNAGCELMPKGGPQLDSISLQQIKCWQVNGYKK